MSLNFFNKITKLPLTNSALSGDLRLELGESWGQHVTMEGPTKAAQGGVDFGHCDGDHAWSGGFGADFAGCAGCRT